MNHDLGNLRDKLWRLENLYKILDKNSRLVKFKLNAVQKRYFRNRKSKRRRILKARQFGFTTFGVIDLLDEAIFKRNVTACILAHKQDVLPKIFGIVRTAFKSMPEKLKPRIEGQGSMYELRFPYNNSKIYTTLEVRGGTVHKLHISEAAFIPEERLRATYQAVPLTGEITQETTPNGLNHFYDAWNIGDEAYQNCFFPWFFHEEYRIPTGPLKHTDEEKLLIATAKLQYDIKISDQQIAFRRFKIKEFKNNVQAFLAEYPEDDQTCFLASGANPFDGFKLKKILDACPKEYETDGEIKIYKSFHKSKSYVISADPAEGVRKDNSVCDVWCIEDREQVAQFASNQYSPSQFAEIIHKMGKLYSIGARWPQAIIERNNHGHAVLLKLCESNEFRYPNLWRHREIDNELGHRTSILTRPLLIDTFIEGVESGMFKINSRETIQECLTLVDNKGKIEAEEGKHDDRVIACALGIKAILERLPQQRIMENIDKRILV